MEKGNKKIIRGWVFYDWANSVYNLVISSAIFPIFYDNVTTRRYAIDKLGFTPDQYDALPKGYDVGNVTVDFFGWELSNSVLISYVISASFLVVSVLSPMLSGVADFSGNKKRFMQFFCYLGAVSCMTLYWFGKVPIEIGMLSVFLASIGFWNSLVFYNAYLPEIAAPEHHDRISARGFSMGYFGSMILLMICLFIIMGVGEKGEYTSVSFILVGIWWIGFSQVTYRVLPNNVYKKKQQKGVLTKGFKELKLVFNEFRKTTRLKRYLLAFFFFNTGVQTVMLMAVIYAKKEINWTEGQGDTGLIIAILLIQILGAAGAFTMSRLSERIGNIRTLITAVAIWVAVCVAAFYTYTPIQFYLLAASVGVVMGGVQSIARSTYSKFLPETQDHASYFSFYDATEKIGIVVGTFSFGLLELLTGSIRNSIISVGFFFVVGLILLFIVPKNEKLKTLTT